MLPGIGACINGAAGSNTRPELLSVTPSATPYRYFFHEGLTTGNGFPGLSTIKLQDTGGTDRALASGGASVSAVGYTPNASFPVSNTIDGSDSSFTTGSSASDAGTGKGQQVDCAASYSVDRLGLRSRSDAFGHVEDPITGKIWAKVNSGDSLTLIRSYDNTADRFQDNEYREFLFSAIDPATVNPLALFNDGVEGVWYDPSDLSTMWKDTAGTTPVTADGDAVARIDDKSGRGHHATQSTSGSRPLYKTDGTKHWLQFDGTDDYMDATTADMAQPNDIAVGCRFASLTGVQTLFDGITSRHAVTKLTSGNGNLDMIANLGSSGSVNTLDVSAGDYAVIAKFNGASSTIRKNKALVLNVVTANPGTGNFNGLRLGASSSGTNFLNGRIYGIIVRDTAMSILETDAVEAWMANKAGASLP